MNQAQLSPSMMCVSPWQNIAGLLTDLKAAGVEWLHADVMDGVFVPNLMLGTESIKYLRQRSDIPLDIHLMIDAPETKLDWFDIQPGEFVSIHAESTRHLQRALAKVRGYGAHPMVAINPGTSLITIEDVLPDVDGVLIMTVNPGFAGQRLVPQTLEKITRLRTMLDANGYQATRIQVDGNVSFEHAPLMRRAGADLFVCGTSSIFGREGTIAENAARLRRCVDENHEESGKAMDDGSFDK